MGYSLLRFINNRLLSKVLEGRTIIKAEIIINAEATQDSLVILQLQLDNGGVYQFFSEHNLALNGVIIKEPN